MKNEVSACLINQTVCGRVAGNPVCPTCGMDERVVYPGQSDLDAALASARERYVAVSSNAGVDERSTLDLQQTGRIAPAALATKGFSPFVVGEIHEGTVAKILDFGAMVRLVDGVEGFMHISEMAQVQPPSVANLLRVGQLVRVKVIGFDGFGLGRLSMLALGGNDVISSVDGIRDSSGSQWGSAAKHSSYRDVIRSYVGMAWGPIWLSSAISIVLIYAGEIFQFFGVGR